MKLELDVLASTCIRRKKPWPRLAFIGHVQESLFLFDSARLSVLYVPSGKTRRKIPKLHPLLPDTAVLSCSDNGHFVCGVLVSGDVFLWHKDTDLLKIIPGMPELADQLTAEKDDHSSPKDTGRLYMCVAGDGAKVLVVVDFTNVYLWQLSPGGTIFDAAPVDTRGCWSRVGHGSGRVVELPDRSHTEACIHAVFCVNDRCVSGLTCVCSMVFTQADSVCVSTLFLRWPSSQTTNSSQDFTVEWKTTRCHITDLSPRACPLRSSVTYVARHTHDTQLLAMAVNHVTSHDTRMTYIHPESGTTISASLKGCGAREAVSAWSYSVVDMQWTSDDLFLVCVTGQGSMCVLTRLGEPILLQTRGCSMEMGPKLYLPLHPLIVVRTSGVARALGESADSQDTFHQRFSVATHPYLPIMLCSDGYMVTVMQLSRDMTCVSLMYDLVVESQWHLEQIEHDTSTQRQHSRNAKPAGLKVPAVTQSVDAVYQFEQAGKEDIYQEDYTVNGVSALERAMQHLDGGRIEFGDIGNMNATIDFAEFGCKTMCDSEHVDMAKHNVLLAWNLAVSHVGLWTMAHEDVMDELRYVMLWLFEVLLGCSSDVLHQLNSIQDSSAACCDNDGLTKVLNLFRTMFKMLRFDSGCRHLMVCAIKLVHATVDVLLRSGDSKRTKACLVALHHSCALLRFSEVALDACYNRQLHHVGVGAMGGQVSKGSKVTSDADSCVAQTSDAKDTDDDVTEVKKPYSEPEPTKNISEQVGTLHRFGMTWRLLYKKTILLHRKLTDKPTHTGQEKAVRKRAKKCLRLLTWLQRRLRALNIDIPVCRKLAINSGAELSINGHPFAAIHAWVQEFEDMPEAKKCGPKGDALLHSVLFLLLVQGRLRSAVEFVEFLLRQNDLSTAVALCWKSWQSDMLTLPLQQQRPLTETSAPPVYIQNRSVRHLVQSLARIMATYFTNSVLFVFPPHTPKRIPPLHTQYSIDSRVLPLDRDHMTGIVSHDQLGDIWTTERAIQYLLMSGLLPEAVWLTRALGDWKSAFVMGVAWSYHQQVAAKVYKRQKTLQLPSSLQPQSVLQDHLANIFQLSSGDTEAGKVTDALAQSDNSPPPLTVVEGNGLDQLKHCFGDLLLAATISHVSTVPWLLESLSEQLGSLCQKFAPLVPEGLYLPAPPVYCPQPDTADKTSLPQSVLSELTLRRRVSSVIRLMLLVLDSSATLLLASRWYIQKVVNAFSKSQKAEDVDQLEFDIEILQDGFLSRPSDFEGHESDPAIRAIIGCFRELCTIVWMLYVRDELSLALRHKATLLQGKLSEGDETTADWEKLCKRALTWAEHLLPFSHYLQGETTFPSILISLVIELPLDGASARLLAQYFYDLERLEAEIQDKMQWVLKEWQGVFVNGKRVDGNHHQVASAHGETLSSCYQKMAQKMDRVLRRKRKLFGQYHEQVFANMAASSGYGTDSQFTENATSCIGSRPMESRGDYLQFLDLFYAVSFSDAVSNENERQRERPLLVKYSSEIQNSELNSLSNQVIGKLQRRESAWSGVGVVSPRRPPLSPRRAVGLIQDRTTHSPRGKLTEKQYLLKQHANGRFLERRHSTEELMECLQRAKTSTPRLAELKRRRSFTEIPSRLKEKAGDTALDAKSSDDTLAELLPQPWLLDKMEFGSGYDKLEQLLEWLSRWGGRSHLLDSHFGKKGELHDADVKPVIRVRVQPRMIMYSLWLLENCYYPTPAATGGSSVVTVNMLHSSEVDHSTAALPPALPVVPPGGSVNDVNAVSTAVVRRKKNKNKNNNERKVKEKSLTSVDATPNTDSISSLYDAMTVTSLTHTSSRAAPRCPARKLHYDEVDIAVDVHKLSTNSEASGETLSVSSLRGTDLRETLEQTLEKLTHSSTKASTSEGKHPKKERQCQTKGKKELNRTLPFPQDKTPPQAARNGRNTKGKRQVAPVEQGHDPGDIAQQMQHMVRSELRKIVKLPILQLGCLQAQQQGMLAMLNVLNTESVTEDSFHSPPRSHQRAPPHHRLQTDLTDSDVTPIQSDDSLFLRSPPYDKPLTMSELAASESVKSPDIGGVTHALHELRLLEGNQRHPRHGTHGKENRLVEAPFGVGPQTVGTLHGAPLQEWNGGPLLGIAPCPSNPAPEYVNVPQAWSNRPLDQYNWSNAIPTMPLLHINNSTSYRLPIGALVQNGAPGGAGYLGSFGLPRLPPPPPLPPPPRFVVPPQRTQLFSMPLLHLGNDEKQFVHIENEGGMPSLIPPQEIIAYEHSRYGSNLLPQTHIMEQAKKPHESEQQLKEHSSAQQTKDRGSVDSSEQQLVSTSQQTVSIGGKLLLVDIEPFASRDERDSRKRMTRRMKKSDLANAVAQRLSETPKKHRKKMSKSLIAEHHKSKTPQRGRSRKSRSRTPESSRSRTPTSSRSRTPGRSKKSKSRKPESPRSRTPTSNRSTTPKGGRSRTPKRGRSRTPKRGRSRTPKRGRSRTPQRHKKSSQGRSPGLDDEPVKLDEGYALSRGLFDHYLNKQDDLGSVVDTNAAIQYRAATAITGQPQPDHRDVAVATDSSLSGQRPTRDTAVSPVAEGLRRYYREETEEDDRGANILAPDVFLNLHFAKGASQNSADHAKVEESHGFLNVVDIGGDLLEELPSPVRQGRTKMKGRTSPHRRPLSPSPHKRLPSPSSPHRDRSSPRKAHASPGRDRQSPRRNFSPQHRARSQSPMKPDVISTGPDALTVKLFEKHPTLEKPWLDALMGPGTGQEKTKEAIRERLRNMNLQFSAIDEMSHQIEQDFRSARSVLNTIEQLAVNSHAGTGPEESTRRSPDALVLRRAHSPERPMSEGSPRQYPSSGSREPQCDSKREAWTSEQRGHGQSERDDLEEDLSGVSSILGEIFVKGQLKAEDVGLTQEVADQLARKATPGRKADGKGGPQGRTEEEQTELKDWMNRKRAEQSREYRRELEELRERERHPYRPGKTSPKRAASKDVATGGSSSRRAKLQDVQQEWYHKRQQQATKLMNEMLNERPHLSTQASDSTVAMTTGKTHKLKHRSVSPATRSRPGKKIVQNIASARRDRQMSPATAGDRKYRIAEAWLEQHRSEADHDGQDLMRVTVDTRTRVVDPKDLLDTDGGVKPHRVTQKAEAEEVDEDYDDRPYTDLVKVQRPEVTRQERMGRPEPKTYTTRLSQLQQQHSDTGRTDATRESLERLYGTTRLPGSFKENERQAPRLVKTYAERLKEMKRQRRPYHKALQPARRHTYTGGAGSRIPVMRRQPPRPRKTMTYAEQLQQLQPPKELYRTGVTLQRQAIRQSHRPPHKTKTYTEMLQELQKPATVLWSPREQFKPHGTRGQHAAMQYSRQARVRPYADPYSEICDDDGDDDTLVSHWSVDERVKKLLYDDDELSNATTDYDISEISDIDDRVLLSNYTDLVDVDQLAEIGSLGSGSVLSFIDWDQIDHLIQDISTDHT